GVFPSRPSPSALSGGRRRALAFGVGDRALEDGQGLRPWNGRAVSGGADSWTFVAPAQRAPPVYNVAAVVFIVAIEFTSQRSSNCQPSRYGSMRRTRLGWQRARFSHNMRSLAVKRGAWSLVSIAAEQSVAKNARRSPRKRAPWGRSVAIKS